MMIQRAIERVHPQHEVPLVSNYVVNARSMLKTEETFHNCTNRVVFHYDDRIHQMPSKGNAPPIGGKVVEELSTLVKADRPIFYRASMVNGITAHRRTVI